MKTPVRIAQIGLGRWGPNLLRNMLDNPLAEVRAVCDRSADQLAKVARYDLTTTQEAGDVLKAGNDVDAVIVATPLSTHYELTRQALESGKHVFVEKPLTRTVAEARELVELARSRGLMLMVGHVFMYNSGIRYMKKLIDDGELGRILFVHGLRCNLGPIRDDASALWDLASHDISIFSYWLNAGPEAVSAIGCPVLGQQLADVINANFHYPGNVTCQILASWLHPKKIRQITVVGDHRMAVWDDMALNEPIRVFDKSVTLREQTHGTFAEFKFTIAEGDQVIPKIAQCEPLRAECDHFIECLANDRQPLSDGANGLEVVRALAAAEASISAGGTRIDLAGMG